MNIELWIRDTDHVAIAKQFLAVSYELRHIRMAHFQTDNCGGCRQWPVNTLQLQTTLSVLGNDFTRLNNIAIEQSGYKRDQVVFDWRTENDDLIIRLRLRHSPTRKPRLVWENPVFVRRNNN